MDDETIEKYRKAGAVGAEIKREVFEMIKPGMRILDLAEKIEEMIVKKGCGIAFPVNIGINEITAHYTPSHDDDRVIERGDLVKIDTGLHIDGFVADIAYTYCDKPHEYVKAAEEALKAAIDAIKPGVSVGEIGEAIYESVQANGLGVIKNLTGHGLDEYVVHGPPNIPNIKNENKTVIEEGTAIAIEPFITETDGVVKDSQPTEIYSFLQPKAVRMKEARQILEISATEFKGLPFAKRWFAGIFSPVKLSMAFRQLVQADALHPYPVLRESQGRAVAQAEHTVIVLEDPIVTTR